MKHRNVLGLLLVFAAAFAGAEALCIRADRDYVDARTRVDKDCAAYRARHPDANVCRDDTPAPSVVRQIEPARKHVANAREAADRNDRDAVKRELVAAMDIAARVERQKTLIAELVAASITRDVVDVVETKKVDAVIRRAVVFHAPDALGTQPMEAMRVDRNQRVVSYGERNWFFGTGLGESLLRGEMKANDRMSGRMTTAIEHGDVDACQAAAKDRGGALAPWTQGGLDQVTCAKYIEVRATAERLNRLRQRS